MINHDVNHPLIKLTGTSQKPNINHTIALVDTCKNVLKLYLFKCFWKKSFIFTKAAISSFLQPSVTWSFRNHSNMTILSFFYGFSFLWKQWFCLNICGKIKTPPTKLYFTFIPVN